MVYTPDTQSQNEQLQPDEKTAGALYVARFRYPLAVGDVILEIHPVPVSMYLSYTDTYILNHFVQIHHDLTTRCLDSSYLNKDIKLSVEEYLYYSESKDACYEWLADKQREAIDFAEYNLQRLSNAEILEMDENNFVCTQQKQKM